MKNGKEWVKFLIQNDQGRELLIDEPIVRSTEVKTKSGGKQARMVIELDMCLGPIKKRVPVNLIDRSHFKFQLLIGRSFLEPDLLVDSSKTYAVTPRCR